MKLRKQIDNKRIIIYILLIIFLLTYTMLDTIGKKSSNNIIKISETLIDDLIIDIVNSSIKNEILKKYNINDLIEFNYNEQREIESINYNVENTYDLLLEIKSNVINTISNSNEYKYYYKYTVSNNNIIIEVPFYNYTSNIYITNIGPKVKSRINFLKTIDSSVKTNVNTYGINTIKLDMYVNFKIISNIIVPHNNKEIENNFDILIASKVINGKIPTYYGSNFKTQSDIFNLS